VSIPPACRASNTNLCKCIMDNGGGDPCYPNGGSSCDDSTNNLPPDEIVCLCY